MKPFSRSLPLVAIAGALVAAAAHARALEWFEVTLPAPGPAQVIGSPAGACIVGAVRLPPEGVGYQAVELSRNRHYGHPDLVDYLVTLGRKVHEAGLGILLVGDMSQPRGGPMSYGHVSHQGGLDVDLSYRLDVPPLPRERREGIEEISFVDPETGRVDPRRWTDRQAELVRLAVSDPRVSRAFVDAAIKRDLCERQWEDRSWLRLVRVWPFHDDHVHVRLRCPEGSPECRDQAPLPPGEACSGLVQPSPARVRRTPRGLLPRACRAILAI
ncbi:MAG TPA: penicillin-insensitive murein endopeptidase [Sandaracinaceae bacterium]